MEEKKKMLYKIKKMRLGSAGCDTCDRPNLKEQFNLTTSFCCYSIFFPPFHKTVWPQNQFGLLHIGIYIRLY